MIKCIHLFLVPPFAHVRRWAAYVYGMKDFARGTYSTRVGCKTVAQRGTEEQILISNKNKHRYESKVLTCCKSEITILQISPCTISSYSLYTSYPHHHHTISVHCVFGWGCLTPACTAASNIGLLSFLFVCILI